MHHCITASVRHCRSRFLGNTGRETLLVRYSGVLGFNVGAQHPFVGTHSIPNDIKGLGSFFVRGRPSPSLICFRRFTSHALLRARVFIPVSVSVCLVTWGSCRLVTVRGHRYFGSLPAQSIGSLQHEPSEAAVLYVECLRSHFTLWMILSRERRISYFTGCEVRDMKVT